MFLDDLGNPTILSIAGHLASGVPGSVAGMWEAHHRFGSMPWESLLEPAINLAHGFVAHEQLAASLNWLEGFARPYRENMPPRTKAKFLPNGESLVVGARLVRPDLAMTLSRIATRGRDGSYQGETADLIVAEMERGGGIITHKDLKWYEALWRQPVVFQYCDHDVESMPPPASGGVVLAETLNILDGFDLGGLGYQSPEHVHRWAEAASSALARHALP